MEKPYAIVIGLDCITGLQTARILHDRNVPVLGIATNPSHWACTTRVCDEIRFANTSNIDLITELEALGPQLATKGVLVPCTDMSVLTISEYRNRLEPWYHVMLPEHATVRTLMDKISFITYAQEHALPIPGTYFLRTPEDAAKAAEALNYPCILKPPMKTPTWEANTKYKVYKVESKAALLALYHEVAPWAELLMVQEWVEGTDANLYSCNCYFDRESTPLVSFIARKIRQWPPEVGISCLGEEVRNDVVRDESLRLFKEANYIGLGYVEMKRDERTGEHFIIEPNIGRPTGRSAIAEAGGVELVYTMYCDAVGLPLPENREQKYTGVKWIYLRQDIRSALYYFRKGTLSLGEWRRSLKGKKAFAVASFRDPLPFWADMFGGFLKMLRR